MLPFTRDPGLIKIFLALAGCDIYTTGPLMMPVEFVVAIPLLVNE
jgi:hypothetical protein